jgi:AraC-like DNA-binding protein
MSEEVVKKEKTDEPESIRLYIKYMVSMRCVAVVKESLKKIGIRYVVVELGMVEILQEITAEQREQLRILLLKSGLELLDDKKSIIIEKVKTLIIEMIYNSDEFPVVNYSRYISKSLGYDYNYLSSMFSEVKGVTIGNYIISIKIERVKELLLYDEYTLTEIAFQLHYSSVAHLSNQFKKHTGLTPSYFKELQEYKKRIALENV